MMLLYRSMISYELPLQHCDWLKAPTTEHHFENSCKMRNFLENRLEVLGKQRKIIMDNFLISSNNFNREIELLSVDVRSPMELNQSPAKACFQTYALPSASLIGRDCQPIDTGHLVEKRKIDC